MHAYPQPGPADLDCLDVVVSWPHEMTVADVAEELQITRDAASSRIRRLRRMGYVVPLDEIIPTGKPVTQSPPEVYGVGAGKARHVAEWVAARYAAGQRTTAGDVAARFEWELSHARKIITAIRAIGVFHSGRTLSPTTAGVEYAANHRIT